MYTVSARYTLLALQSIRYNNNVAALAIRSANRRIIFGIEYHNRKNSATRNTGSLVYFHTYISTRSFTLRNSCRVRTPFRGCWKSFARILGSRNRARLG